MAHWIPIGIWHQSPGPRYHGDNLTRWLISWMYPARCMVMFSNNYKYIKYKKNAETVMITRYIIIETPKTSVHHRKETKIPAPSPQTPGASIVACRVPSMRCILSGDGRSWSFLRCFCADQIRSNYSILSSRIWPLSGWLHMIINVDNFYNNIQ